MIIKAKFLGANYSLGFKIGEVYRLRFKCHGNEIKIQDRDRAHVICPYGSLIMFLKNWEVME